MSTADTADVPDDDGPIIIDGDQVIVVDLSATRALRAADALRSYAAARAAHPSSSTALSPPALVLFGRRAEDRPSLARPPAPECDLAPRATCTQCRRVHVVDDRLKAHACVRAVPCPPS